jgi:hypothetical protein
MKRIGIGAAMYENGGGVIGESHRSKNEMKRPHAESLVAKKKNINQRRKKEASLIAERKPA